MPYKLVGRTIYTKSSGAWKKKQTCTSLGNAKKALRLLEALEHGTLRRRRRNSGHTM